MRTIARTLARKHPRELFFHAWISATIVLALYIATVASMVNDVSVNLWLIGAPIALMKAALIISGLGFLVWFVFIRRDS